MKHSLLNKAERVLRLDIRYALNSGFWLNMGSAVTILGSFLISIAFANLLPKETFGTYQYLLSLLAILSSFTLTGMNSAITRAVAQGNDGALRGTIRSQLIWNSFSGVAALCISAYYLVNGDIRLGVGTVAIAIALPLISTFNSYAAFLIGKKAFRTHFLFTTVANVSYYLAILLALMLVPAVLPLIVTNLVLTAAAPVVLYAVTLKRFKLDRTSSDHDAVSYGKHLSIMNLLGNIASQLDSFLVFHFLGPVQLATYSMATLIPERLGGVFKNITTGLLPRFAEQPLERIRAGIFRKSLLFAAMIGSVIGAYVIVSPWFFAVIYPQYLDAVPFSQIFSLTLLMALGNFIGTALLAHRKVKGLYIVNTVTPIANLALQTLGIMVWGLWGLILGRVIATVIYIGLIIPFVFLSSKAEGAGAL